MALINLGTSPNTATGDTLYYAFAAINTIIGNGNGNIATCTATGLGSMSAINTGANNTANGNLSLANNTSGINNTAIGFGALYNAISINNNTSIGYNALAGNTSFSNCTGLGAGTIITASNQVQLGDATTIPYAYQALSLRSDLRDKAEVRDTILGLNFINELRPVDYKWDIRDDYRTDINQKANDLIHDGTHTRSRFHHGLIAQEVQEVIEASGVDFGGFQDHKVGGGEDVLSIGYDELIAPMIKAIQELTARINVLEGN